MFYVARKNLEKKQALKMVGDLMDTFEICSVNRDVLRSALRLDVTDFEDAIQLASALAEGLDFIVTRDAKDYKNSPVTVITPVNFIKKLE